MYPNNDIKIQSPDAKLHSTHFIRSTSFDFAHSFTRFTRSFMSSFHFVPFVLHRLLFFHIILPPSQSKNIKLYINNLVKHNTNIKIFKISYHYCNH